MMNFFKKENTKTNQYHSVTFRVDSEDKTKLSNQAENLKISLSEYIRKKVLMDDTELLQIMNENSRLKKQIEEYDIQSEANTSNNTEPGNILLKTTEEGKEILKMVLSEMRWNRFENKRIEIDSDFLLSKAIGFLLVEQIIEPLNEMSGLRKKFYLEKIEELFNRILEYYLE